MAIQTRRILPSIVEAVSFSIGFPLVSAGQAQVRAGLLSTALDSDSFSLAHTVIGSQLAVRVKSFPLILKIAITTMQSQPRSFA